MNLHLEKNVRLSCLIKTKQQPLYFFLLTHSQQKQQHIGNKEKTVQRISLQTHCFKEDVKTLETKITFSSQNQEQK